MSNRENIQIAWQPPTGLQAALFWFDTEGRLHELPSQESSGTLYYPKARHGDPLSGPPGTEVIFVCGRQGKPPTAADIQPLIDGQGIWPELAANSVLTFSDRQSPEVHRTLHEQRGPSFRLRQREGTAVETRARQLVQSLTKVFPWFEGLAFPHVIEPKPTANLQ